MEQGLVKAGRLFDLGKRLNEAARLQQKMYQPAPDLKQRWKNGGKASLHTRSLQGHSHPIEAWTLLRVAKLIAERPRQVLPSRPRL